MLRLCLLVALSVLTLPAAAQTADAPPDVAAALKADQDSRINLSVRMASDAQAYYLKPTEFGGGEGSFEGVSLAALEYAVTDTGHYVRTTESGAIQTFELTLHDGVVTITATSDQAEDAIRTTVSGPTVRDISVTF